jgi:hypothetical protein
MNTPLGILIIDGGRGDRSDSKSIWILGGNPEMGYALTVFNFTDNTNENVNLPLIVDGEWLGLNSLDEDWYRQH